MNTQKVHIMSQHTEDEEHNTHTKDENKTEKKIEKRNGWHCTHTYIYYVRVFADNASTG